MNLDKVKLVIWDLDETFWDGVLSENTCKPIEKNIILVKKLAYRGIISSICSKNDFNVVQNKLKELNIEEFFVFNSINWTPKGKRCKQIIEDMNLRAENVLFIDDNLTNLNEVKYYSPNIMIGLPNEVLPIFEKKMDIIGKEDANLSRLNNYKILEAKHKDSLLVNDNLEFLMQSNIKVKIYNDSINEIERIYELVQRTNQLNFTKIRSSKKDLMELIKNPCCKNGYIKVSDNYGDYGIVGFFAIKNNNCIHFVFSCRTLGMGVEQYIYYELGKPKLKIIGEVSSDLNVSKPTWINTNKTFVQDSRGKIAGKVVFKGPCDMSQIFNYIEKTDNLITEFTYVGKNGVSIEQHNHTVQIVESLTLQDDRKKEIISELPFSDENMFTTAIFDKDVKCVFLSLFTDPNLGVYRRKSTGEFIAFGEYIIDFTDSSNWSKIINKEVFVATKQFTVEELKAFAEKYEYIGRIEIDDIIKNLHFIRKNMNKNALLILNIGSTKPYLKETNEAYLDRAKVHKELKEKVFNEFKDHKLVKFNFMDDYIKSQNDFSNNINHFTRKIYYQISQNIINILNINGSDIKSINRMHSFINRVRRKIKSILKCNKQLKE